MRKPKKSAYDQKRGALNVTDFAKEKASRAYRLEQQTKQGVPSLKLIVPRPEIPAGEQAIDISYLFDCPNLMLPFSEALLYHFQSARKAFATMIGNASQINREPRITENSAA